jgi:hypothetical protein
LYETVAVSVLQALQTHEMEVVGTEVVASEPLADLMSHHQYAGVSVADWKVMPICFLSLQRVTAGPAILAAALFA